MKEVLSSYKMSVLTEPRGVTSQKTPFFIVTAVKTSNLTKLRYGLYVRTLLVCESQRGPVQTQV
jgi:hypothetical protein